MEGAFEYYKYKSFGDEACLSIQTYKNDYMSKIDISTLFLKDRCEIDNKYRMKTSDVFDSYVEYWCVWRGKDKSLIALRLNVQGLCPT